MIAQVGVRDCDGDSKTTIGEGSFRFDVELSMCNEAFEWIYCSAENNVVSVCRFLESDLPAPASLQDLVFTSKNTNIRLNQWVVLKNTSGRYAAIRLTEIFMAEDEQSSKVRFVYAIFDE